MRLLRWAQRLLLVSLAAASFGVAAAERSHCPPAAQAPTPQQADAGLKNARDRGFLWRIRKNGRTSYLYGTVHVAKLDWMFPGTRLLDAVRASDVIALELDVLDPDIMRRLHAGMALKPGGALKGPLAARLKAQLDAACLPDEWMTTMSPEMLATTLTVMAGREEGLDPAYAIDAVVAGLGHGLRKPVSSLETPEMQLALLQGRTPQETQTVVEQALAELESGRATPMLARMAQVWAESRLNELERYEQWCDCLDTNDERALHKRLLEDRNPALADRIDALHGSGKQVFAAVGSLHMIGVTGLPALLASRGYDVELVDFKE